MAGGTANALAAPALHAYTDFFTGDATPFIAEGITRDTVTGSVFVASVAGAPHCRDPAWAVARFRTPAG